MSDTAVSVAADTARVQRVLSVIGDPAGLRILDLAARTGWFTAALAERGAAVHAIEGRAANAAHIPAHPHVTVEVGDVRSLSRQAHGMFDVSLCLGLLYHLDGESALALLQALAQVTRHYVIIDTHVGAPAVTLTLGGRDYMGSLHTEDTTHPWSALGNQLSFWFTLPDLVALVLAAGFTTAELLPGKGHPLEQEDRAWLKASR